MSAPHVLQVDVYDGTAAFLRELQLDKDALTKVHFQPVTTSAEHTALLPVLADAPSCYAKHRMPGNMQLTGILVEMLTIGKAFSLRGQSTAWEDVLAASAAGV